MPFRSFATFLFFLLPTISVHAQNQSKAVVATNYLISLKRSEADNTESNYANMNMVMPAGQLSGVSLSYNYLNTSEEIVTIEESDTKTKGYAISYFLRDFSLGSIGYETIRLDRKLESETLTADIASNILTEKADIDINNLYTELYLDNTTFSYSKIKSKYESSGKLEGKEMGISWYLSPNFLISYSINKMDTFGSTKKTETKHMGITYQPQFAKNILSISLNYSRDKDIDELDTVALLFNFYFQSPVGLKDRDRKFQYRSPTNFQDRNQRLP